MPFTAAPTRVAATVARPKARLAVALALVAILGLGGCMDADTQQKESALLQLTQSARNRSRMPALQLHGGLREVARRHAEHMAGRGALFHSGDLTQAVSAVVPGWTRVGENVAVGSSMDGIHNSLMASPGHRANILGNYTMIGIGVARDGRGRYWVTQVFAK